LNPALEPWKRFSTPTLPSPSPGAQYVQTVREYGSGHPRTSRLHLPSRSQWRQWTIAGVQPNRTLQGAPNGQSAIAAMQINVACPTLRALKGARPRFLYLQIRIFGMRHLKRGTLPVRPDGEHATPWGMRADEVRRSSAVLVGRIFPGLIQVW